jgi:phage regulator Rha-like protein
LAVNYQQSNQIINYKNNLFMNENVILKEDAIANRIYLIRGMKVMLDRDLAEMYGVETKRLKEAVRRNMNRFPIDFMFEMTPEELQNWRSQIASSNSLKMGLRYKPFCFTEQGVAMLSSVLNSETAIEVNIQIIRVFTRMRQFLANHQELLFKMEQFENALKQQTTKNKEQDENIDVIFNALKQLLHQKSEPRPRIGFKP